MNDQFYLRAVRAIEGTEAGGGGNSTTDETHSQSEISTPDTTQKSETADSDSDKSTDSGDSEGRGSKRAVLADLARERDRRQQAEDKLKELEKKASDLDKLNEQVSTLMAESHKLRIEKVLTQFNLPAEMAGRLRGETIEELTEDAKALAAVVSASTPTDPTQGKSATAKPVSLEDALARRFS